MPDRDSELLASICQKDEKAFGELYKSHYKRLFILAYQYVKTEETAEEIVNDVLMKIWTDASRLNISHALKPYLDRSVVNRSLNILRQQNRLTAKQNQYRADVSGAVIAEDEGHILESQLLRLEKAMEDLPPQCRKILMMSKFEKCKQQEIADRLQLSIKTVKNQLTIGYEKIRHVLSDNSVVSIILICTFFRTFFQNACLISSI